MTAAEAPAKAGTHVGGLDALRFVLALWVALGHVGFPPLPAALDRGASGGLYGAIPNGAAAVMVFFVISGFCIHYPFRAAKTIDLWSFYARRHVRILLPIVGAVVLARPLGINLGLFQDSILWSLVCEEIYYTIYPLLLWLRARVGWTALIGAAFAAAGVVIGLHWPEQPLYAVFGWQLNWVVGLPCWLLGALLAEKVGNRQSAIVKWPSGMEVWGWRLGALVIGSIGTNLLYFHSPVRIPYPISLDLFAIYAFFWLRCEIRYAEAYGVSLLERFGVFSYSMYLVHLQANAIFTRLLGESPLGGFGTWAARVLWVILFSWMFSLAVERPAHQLARRFQQRVLRWRNA